MIMAIDDDYQNEHEYSNLYCGETRVHSRLSKHLCSQPARLATSSLTRAGSVSRNPLTLAHAPVSPDFTATSASSLRPHLGLRGAACGAPLPRGSGAQPRAAGASGSAPHGRVPWC